MKEIQLFLIPAPNAKPEFLAKIRPIDNDNNDTRSVWESLRDTITLEGYTRDTWAWKPGGSHLTTISAQSTDGRKKIPGFVKYLRERQKSAYGRFSPAGVFVVSYVQQSGNNDDQLDCRIATDLTKIPNCPLRPKQPAPAAAAPARKPPAAASTKPGRARGGLLGKLVGAQQRTNQHVVKSRPTPTAVLAEQTRTAADVFTEFRQLCNKTMLDFDIASDDVLKIPVSLQEQQTGLSNEEKAKVTIEMLKFMVYEAAEEVNEEWICYKEPTEFVDEVTTIAVYKEGAAPPEVLEEINQGDLPDEVKGQQRSMQEQRERHELLKAAKEKELAEQRAHMEVHADEEELNALNAKKRDRRTVQDFELERKRGRTS